MTSEQRWHEMIAKCTEKWGPVAGNPVYPIQHHHVTGRKSRQRHPKTHESILIGTWFVIPLPEYLHMGTENPNSIAVSKKNFVRTFGKQSGLWNLQRQRIMAMDIGELPFGSDVVDAILATNE
jgi:hypothetical protein